MNNTQRTEKEKKTEKKNSITHSYRNGWKNSTKYFEDKMILNATTTILEANERVNNIHHRWRILKDQTKAVHGAHTQQHGPKQHLYSHAQAQAHTHTHCYDIVHLPYTSTHWLNSLHAIVVSVNECMVRVIEGEWATTKRRIAAIYG